VRDGKAVVERSMLRLGGVVFEAGDLEGGVPAAFGGCFLEVEALQSEGVVVGLEVGDEGQQLLEGDLVEVGGDGFEGVGGVERLAGGGHFVEAGGEVSVLDGLLDGGEQGGCGLVGGGLL